MCIIDERRGAPANCISDEKASEREKKKRKERKNKNKRERYSVAPSSRLLLVAVVDWLATLSDVTTALEQQQQHKGANYTADQ